MPFGPMLLLSCSVDPRPVDPHPGVRYSEPEAHAYRLVLSGPSPATGLASDIEVLDLGDFGAGFDDLEQVGGDRVS